MSTAGDIVSPMILKQHLNTGSKVTILHIAEDRTDGTVLNFDDHGVSVDDGDNLIYVPWTSVNSLTIHSTPDYDISKSVF